MKRLSPVGWILAMLFVLALCGSDVFAGLFLITSSAMVGVKSKHNARTNSQPETPGVATPEIG
jgi:hypothetical protein